MATQRKGVRNTKRGPGHRFELRFKDGVRELAMGTETWTLEPGGREHGERVVNVDRIGMGSPDGRSAVGVDHICSERLKVSEVERDVTRVQF